MEEQVKKLDELARNVLTMSRDTLLVRLRFLDMALSMLKFKPYMGSVSTDGKILYYNPIHILKNFKNEREYCTREYLHMILHCVFRHMFIGATVEKRLWNLACDIAVESAISEMHLTSVEVKKATAEEVEFDILKKKTRGLTAEKIYKYLYDENLNEEQIVRLETLFLYDDHSVWYNFAGTAEASGRGTGEDGDGNTVLSALESMNLADEWKNVAERMQQDLETFSRQQGDLSGNMMLNLKEVNREKYDYSKFLRKFAVRTEAMKINDDEFDYLFYTYGLNLYKKMPLIEPLEYKDVKRIREFVIAIDTSGSTSMGLVQKFLQKTYNIMKSVETFTSKINLHIIQCDAQIQEDAKITSQEEFDSYLKKMTIKGLGGTDFRPVFEYVSDLQQKHEFNNLKGLIYFTDGVGTFPAKKPKFDTAFVFVDDEYDNLCVPSWAMKLVLKTEEI